MAMTFYGDSEMQPLQPDYRNPYLQKSSYLSRQTSRTCCVFRRASSATVPEPPCALLRVSSSARVSSCRCMLSESIHFLLSTRGFLCSQTSRQKGKARDDRVVTRSNPYSVPSLSTTHRDANGAVYGRSDHDRLVLVSVWCRS